MYLWEPSFRVRDGTQQKFQEWHFQPDEFGNEVAARRDGVGRVFLHAEHSHAAKLKELSAEHLANLRVHLSVWYYDF